MTIERNQYKSFFVQTLMIKVNLPVLFIFISFFSLPMTV